ncbi:MAG TPA: hypothetical protein VF092_00545 [Longimicrobium sp.]
MLSYALIHERGAMALETKDLITLGLSSFALAISVLNFYVQQIRKRDRLIGSLLSVSVHEGRFNSVAEYSLSNVGDTQLVLKEARMVGEPDPEVFGGQPLLPCAIENLPCVLKPGEVVVISIQYDRGQTSNHDQVFVEFVILSAKGKYYQLPHVLISKDHGSASWETFRLQSGHAPRPMRTLLKRRKLT